MLLHKRDDKKYELEIFGDTVFVLDHNELLILASLVGTYVSLENNNELEKLRKDVESARKYGDEVARINKQLVAELKLKDEVLSQLNEIVVAASSVVREFGNTEWQVGSMRALTYLIQRRQERLQNAIGESHKGA